MSEPHRPDPDRDPLLDAAWKAHSTELPPARVDAAVLAAAHREARTRPQPVDDDAHARARGPFRPWWGLAAAATIGAIAFGVLQVAPLQETQEPTTVASDVPASVSPSPQPSLPKSGGEGASPMPRKEPARIAESDQRTDAKGPSRTEPRSVARQEKANATPVKPAAPAPREVTQPESRPPAVAQANRDAMTAAAPAPQPERAEPRPFPGQEAPSAAAPPPAAPPTALTKAESQAPGFAARRRESDERAATPGRANADAAAPAAAPAPVAKLATRPPAAWIERIRMLHAEQRFDEAARELNAFRDAYPDADARLPESLRGWAASVPRAR